MTDEKIVELYFERSEEAIKESEKAYGPYLQYIARSILKSEEDANEIVNDAYMKAWNSIPPLKPSPLKPFLGRITRQLAINRLEYLSAGKRTGETLSVDELADVIPDEVSENDLKDALDRFLRKEPTLSRRIFILRYWYGLNADEIAKKLGVRESRVNGILFRARKRLKEHLEKEGFHV